MKKIFLFFTLGSCFLIGSFLVYSCRKDAGGGTKSGSDIAQNLESAKVFYAQGATLNDVTYSKLMEESIKEVFGSGVKPKKAIFRKLKPLWKDAFQLKAFDGVDLIIVPTLENRFSEKKFEIRRFFIFTANRGSITGGQIVEFLDRENSLQENVNNFIVNYKNSSILNLTGAIFEYDLNYFLEKAEVIKQGKRTGTTAKLYNLPAAKNSGPNKTTYAYYDSDPYGNTGCYKLWLCDGNTFGVTCTFQGYTGTCESDPPSGSDSGYDSSGSQQSGGGSPYGGNPEPPSFQDPCAKAKALANAAGFKSNMTSLQNGLSNHYETAVVIKSDGSILGYNNGPGGVNDNIPLSALINSKGIMHNHETNHDAIVNLSIFSAPDIRGMYQGVSGAQQIDKAAYIFSLVTPTGSYLLSINNLSNFLSWGNRSFATESSFQSFELGYNVFVRLTQTPAQNEAFLQKYLEDQGTGLQLMKNTGTQTSPTWKQVKNNGGSPSYTICP